MLESLEIKNFQSLNHIKMDLGPITVITGPSNIGKSAIVRALYTLFRNNFLSSSVSKGSSTMSVTVTGEGNSVSFRRDGNVTSYVYNDAVYEKLAGAVPDKVITFLNSSPVRFDKDLVLDLNFSKQFDPPFILNLSGFEVAKVFGKLMDIDLVLASSRTIANDIVAKEKQKDVMDLSIMQVQEFLADESFINIERKKELIDFIDKLLDEQKQIQDKIQIIQNALTKIQNLKAKIQIMESKTKKLNLDLIQYNEQLPQIIETIKASKEKKKLYEAKLKVLDLQVPTPDSVDALQKTIQKIVQAVFTRSLYLYKYKLLIDTELNLPKVNTDDLIRIQRIVNQMKNDSRTIATQSLEQEKVVINLKKVQIEFKNFIKQNNVCPLTNMPYSEHCIDYLIGENSATNKNSSSV